MKTTTPLLSGPERALGGPDSQFEHSGTPQDLTAPHSGSELIQVTDVDGITHAAAVGPGVLCQRTAADLAAPAVQTVAWADGIDAVDCQACLQQVAALRSLPTRHRMEQVA